MAKAETSVWRLGSFGVIITSVLERVAIEMAEVDPTGIYFYADLENSSHLIHTENTMTKVYSALKSVGLSESQIIDSVNAMQNEGIYFREMGF